MLRTILTPKLKRIWSTYRLVSHYLGHNQSISSGESIDAHKRAIPWITYPALELLMSLDTRDQRVLEIGSGNSTIWWSKRCQNITSVENVRLWYDKIRNSTSSNVTIDLRTDPDEYIRAVLDYDFDILVIDADHRLQIAQMFAEKVDHQSVSIIILDNADWYPGTVDILENLPNFLRIDLSGIGPINSYQWTTSIFINTNKALKYQTKPHPRFGIAKIKE